MAIFFLGIVTSIIASILFYVLRYELGFLINFIFFKLYPKISGEYDVYLFGMKRKYNNNAKSTEEESTQSEDMDRSARLLNSQASDHELLAFLKKRKQGFFIKLKLKQFANRITGVLYVIKDGERTNIEKIKGQITASRVIILNSEAVQDDHHNFGTYLLTIKNDAHIIKGVRNYLCVSCGEASPDHIILERK